MNEQQTHETDEALAEAEEQRMVKLDAIGLVLSAKRKEAIEGKLQLGIDQEMQEDEEYYQGYDDANRHEFVNTASSRYRVEGKTLHQNQSKDANKKGSTVFPNITQPYVDAMAARTGDVLLPTDDRNYSLARTPIPNMGPMEDTEPGQEPSEAKAMLDKLMAEADRKAKLAEDQIEDWLQECQYNTEMRKVIDDTVRLGSGIIKGPVPVKRQATKMTRGEDNTITLEIVDEIKPASFRVDPRDFFPDPACGESIHNGSYTFERDYLTAKRLEAFSDMQKPSGKPFYIPSQIQKVLKEGPGKRRENNDNRETDQISTKNQFEIWYVYIDLKAEELIACGCDVEEEGESFSAIITMVNDTVIRAALNPFDTGIFPYDLIPWKRRPSMPWGMSLSRQLRTPQRIVVGATRRLMDNLGLASGPQILVSRGVQPENGIWEVVPLKIWVEDDDAVSSPKPPVQSVVIPTMQAELAATIQLGMKMAEEVTGMPMLMQGQQGSAPETVGGMTILNNNANAVLRRIARLFDSCGTVPQITRYYDYLMNYGEDEDLKGDFQVVAKGSTALVERDIQSREMVGVLQLCLNPAYGKDPKKAMDEYLKSRRFDTKAFDYTEEELKKMEEAAQQQQPAPQVEAAKIRAQVDMEKLKANNQMDEQRILAQGQMTKAQMDASMQLDGAKLELERQREQADQQIRMAELQMKLQIAQLEYANKNGMSLDKLKTEMATTAMKLNLQKELSVSGAGGEVIKPTVEPGQRAPDGQSFQQ